jgi:cytochrome c biogenesis protein CcmG/thiol:disulfide interchange protein DsbE
MTTSRKPLVLATLALILVLTAASWAKDKTELGKPAPDFTLRGLTSEEAVTLSALKGRVVLIDFWASWCVPCRQLMPRIAEIKTRFPDVEVIAISVDTDRDKALTFVRAVDSGLRAVHDTAQKVADAYKVERMPSSFVIDKQGNLRFRHDGYGPKALASVERQLQLLLNE